MRDTQNPALMRAFASEVKARRAAIGISQEELAHRSDVNRTFIGRLELASTQPSLSVLLKIAIGLETGLPELVAATLERYSNEFRSDKGGVKQLKKQAT
jgi:transcriptional regulator with XRE-family HTH domain